MGSFNVTCAISGMNIEWGEPTTIIRLEKTKYPNKTMIGANSKYEISAFPVKATYDDYGYFTDIEKKPINDFFPALDGEKNKFMAIHQSIYEKFSSRFMYQDEGKWILERSPLRSLKHMQKVVEKCRKKLHNTKDRVYGDVSIFFVPGLDDDLDYINRILRLTPFHSLSYMIKSREDIDKILSSEFATEYFEFGCFFNNLDMMHKHFLPSIYASQTDRNYIYGQLTKAMNAVLGEKRQRRIDDGYE